MIASLISFNLKLVRRKIYKKIFIIRINLDICIKQYVDILTTKSYIKLTKRFNNKS